MAPKRRAIGCFRRTRKLDASIILACLVHVPEVSLPDRGSDLPSNAWFLGLTRVRPLNGISIGSAVFAGLTVVINTPTTLRRL